jgi:hypothetical protein
MKSSWYFNIPVDLYFTIEDYLFQVDYYQLMNCNQQIYDRSFPTRKFFLCENDIRGLLTPTASLAEIFLQKIFKPKNWNPSIPLNNSIQFKMEVKDRKTAELIPNCQLQVNFRYASWKSSLDFDLDNSDIMKFLSNRYSLELEKNKELTSLAGLSNVRKMSIDNFFELTDAVGLSCLQELTLRRCFKLQDLRPLKNLMKLEIVSCPLISDVSLLSGVHDLHIDKCPAIKDITCLRKNYSLCIRRCPGVMVTTNDLANFANVVSLETDFIHSLEGLETFRQMKCLKLRMKAAAPPIPSFHSQVHLQHFLSRLHTFDLYGMNSLLDLRGLSSIPVLVIGNCPLLQDISALTTMHPPRDLKRKHSITIISCARITDFSPLNFHHRVTIINCKGFTNGYEVDQVYHLRIELCDYILDFDMLGRVSILELIRVPIMCFDGLSTVKQLTVLGESNPIKLFRGIFGSLQQVKVILSEDIYEKYRQTIPCNAYDDCPPFHVIVSGITVSGRSEVTLLRKNDSFPSIEKAEDEQEKFPESFELITDETARTISIHGISIPSSTGPYDPVSNIHRQTIMFSVGFQVLKFFVHGKDSSYQYLRLSKLPSLISIRGLKGVAIAQVVIEDCPLLSDISALCSKTSSSVTIRNCPLIESFSPLNAIEHCTLVECPLFTGGNRFHVQHFHVQQLLLHDCPNFDAALLLTTADQLTITGDHSSIVTLGISELIIQRHPRSRYSLRTKDKQEPNQTREITIFLEKHQFGLDTIFAMESSDLPELTQLGNDTMSALSAVKDIAGIVKLQFYDLNSEKVLLRLFQQFNIGHNVTEQLEEEIDS